MGYTIHHTKAQLIFRRKRLYEDGEIVELKARAGPPSPARPEGIKYSMVYIDTSRRRILGYDNAEGKGHHRHFGDEEMPLAFDGLEALVLRFLGEVSRLRGRPQ